MTLEDKHRINLSEYFAKGFTYTEYIDFVQKQLDKGLSTDNLDIQDLLDYTKLNLSRSRRVEKKVSLSDYDKEFLDNYPRKLAIILITEGWCGDAAQILPVVNLIVSNSPNLELRIVLRGSNMTLMNQYKYNNTLSIPIVVAYDIVLNQEVFIWGPRPKVLLDFTKKIKEDENYDKNQFSIEVQEWYNKDKGKTIIDEIIAKLKLA